MKILFFIESLRSGGKERRLVELIKGLLEISTIEMELVLTKNVIHYNEIKLLNVKIHYTIRRKGFKKDPKVFYSFYKIVKKYKPDVIHVWGNLVAIYAIPTKVFFNIPMINNQISDSNPLKIKSSFLNHNLSFFFSEKIVANSYAGLKAYKAPIDKSSVIYNGFDFKRIKGLKDRHVVRQELGITTKYVVGMVASFSDKKDYFTYIKSVNIVLKKNKEVTFLCIGSGDYSPYEKMVEIENKDRVIFMGKQTKVEEIMNSCNIGVLATFTEGIPNSLLEFMALEKPVVVTGGGGCGELIEHGLNGYIFETGNYLELSKSLCELLFDQDLSNKFGKKSFQIVEEQFNIQSMLFNFMKMYKEII